MGKILVMAMGFVDHLGQCMRLELGIKVLIICKNMFLQFRNAFKESFMDCSPIMSHEQSGKSRHGYKQSYCREVPRCEIFME